MPGTDGVVIDDEKLQELLAKASSLYNNGEYKGAIEAWQGALTVDPASQKAREGIRMATLLLGDFDSAPPAGPEEASALPADGADTTAADLPVEEAEARLDLGVARVKQLLAERKYAEAIEGAQGLLPLGPDSPEILSLLEEAQHAFESVPFIEEHLSLARELLNQERFSEAEAECKKVFTLDATHPGAKALLKDIRDKIQASLKAAASRLGGMTVKLTMPQAIAAGVKLRSGAPVEPPKAPTPKAAAAPPPDVFEGSEPVLDEEPQTPESGPGALAQEDVAARAALEAAFKDPSLGATTPEESPFETTSEGPVGIGVPVPPAAKKEEVVEARTIRPPTSRVVPKGPVPAEPPAPASPVEPPPVVSGHTKKTPEPSTPPTQAKTPAAKGVAAASTMPPAPASKTASPKPVAPHTPAAPAGAVPVSDVGEDATAAWETELTQLNLKDKERGLLRGTGAKATGAPVQAGDMDLMSLLDSGGMPGMPGSEAEQAAPQAEPVPLAKQKESTKPHARVASPAEKPAARERPSAAVKLRAPDRPRPAATPKSGSSVMKYLLLLIILAGGGWGGWYLYTQPGLLQRLLPRLLGGAGQPSQPVAPPAGSPSGTVDGGHGPIPTPIGGTSRQQAAVPQQGDPSSPSSTGAMALPGGPASGAATAPPSGPGTAPPPQAAVPGAGGSAPHAGTSQNTGVNAAPVTSRVPPSSEPIKPTTVPPLSKEEMQRKIATYTADGRRLMGLGKWREARAKLSAVLALDPANIEVKDLADKAQAKIDENQSLQDEFDSTKRLYAEKDYENALRKLYRLPRDKGLGDVDLYIRNAWYNWAVVLMKAGNSKDAIVKLSEELAVDPDDAFALKLQEVAEKYTNRAKDRTYYAFTDGLTLRAFDQK